MGNDLNLNKNGEKEKKMKSCKMDLVVFVNQQAKVIVECKSWSNSYTRNAPYRLGSNSKQIGKYRAIYQIPVLVCAHMNQVDETIREITKILADPRTSAEINKALMVKRIEEK